MGTYNVDDVISVTRTGAVDVERYLVEKDIDGGGYATVGYYNIDRTIQQDENGEDYLAYDDFSYDYTVLSGDVGEITLRFTPQAPAAGVSAFTEGPHTVSEQRTGEVATPYIGLAVRV